MRQLKKRPHNFKDLTGKKFGRLTVLSLARNTKRKDATFWNCVCSCGNKTIVASGHLGNGHTNSCGCFHRDLASLANSTHGMSNEQEYIIWNAMKQRCANPNNKAFRYYGGLGVKVCKRWLTSFAAFLEDMGHRPSIKHSIDRIDPFGDYKPSNCRWATVIEQRLNTRRRKEKELNEGVMA